MPAALSRWLRALLAVAAVISGWGLFFTGARLQDWPVLLGVVRLIRPYCLVGWLVIGSWLAQINPQFPGTWQKPRFVLLVGLFGTLLAAAPFLSSGLALSIGAVGFAMAALAAIFYLLLRRS